MPDLLTILTQQQRNWKDLLQPCAHVWRDRSLMWNEWLNSMPKQVGGIQNTELTSVLNENCFNSTQEYMQTKSTCAAMFLTTKYEMMKVKEETKVAILNNSFPYKRHATKAKINPFTITHAFSSPPTHTHTYMHAHTHTLLPVHTPDLVAPGNGLHTSCLTAIKQCLRFYFQ